MGVAGGRIGIIMAAGAGAVIMAAGAVPMAAGVGTTGILADTTAAIMADTTAVIISDPGGSCGFPEDAAGPPLGRF